MRTFSAGFQTKLAAGTFNPVVFMDYTLKEYISADDPGDGSLITTVYRWSEREITYGGNTYQARLVKLSTLDFNLDASQQVFGEMSVQVGNNIDQLISVIQPGMTATVYLGFEESDGSVTDAEVMFIGTVEGDIEITEDSVSFNLQDIAYSYDRQMPNLVDEANYPGAGREDVGLPIPIIVGRAKDHICRSITGQFTTYVAEDVQPSYNPEDVWQQNSDKGLFAQTTQSLESQFAGGPWYCVQYDADIGMNAETSEDGTGLDISPASGGDTIRIFRTNTLSNAIPFKRGEYYEIIVSVSNWTAGNFQFSGPFFDPFDKDESTTIYYSKKYWAATDSASSFAFKVTENESVADNTFDVIISNDFNGIFKVTRISKLNTDSSKNYIYVTDDIAHWYRSNATENETTNVPEIDKTIAIEHQIDQDSDYESFSGKILSYHVVTDIEHDVTGFRVESSTLCDGSDVILVNGDEITMTGTKPSVGEYLPFKNGALVTDVTSIDYSTDGGLYVLDDLTQMAEVLSVSGDVVTIDQELTPNYYQVVSPTGVSVNFSGNTITANDPFFDFSSLGFSGGLLLSVTGSSSNDGYYTIISAIGNVIAISGAFSTESMSYPSLGAITNPINWGGGPAWTILSYNVYNYPKNLWKMTLQDPIPTYGFSIGDSIRLSSTADEVFVIADHPVQKISNVRVNGVPIDDSGELYYLSTGSYGNDAQNRSYLVIPFDKLANVARLAFQVDEQSKLVIDDSYTDDSIFVDDPGHTHVVGDSARTFSWALDINFNIFGYGSYSVYVNSGSYSNVVDTESGVLQNPVRFTSNSPECTVTFSGANWLVRQLTVQFERVDSISGESLYDFGSASGSGVGIGALVRADMPEPADASTTGGSIANVIKIGNAATVGGNNDTGYLFLDPPISLAQARSALRITCDVIGNPDGSLGYKMPHEQIKTIINKYAQNPVNGTEGNADIVEFVNEAEMIAAFSKVWNTFSSLDAAEDIWPRMRELVNVSSESATNLSPDSELGNSVLPILREGENAKAYNEKSIHCLDFAINSTNQLRDLIGEMLLHSNMICIWRNGIAYLKYLPDTPSADDTLTTADVVMKSMSLTRSPVSHLATDITVNYDYGKDGFSRNYHYAKQVWEDGVLSITKLDATRKYGSYSRERFFDMPMIRERAAAEILAKRFYQEFGDAKFHSRFESVLANLALEPGDNVTVPIPIHRDSVMDRGLITRKTITWGSAVDKKPDLINFDVRENHTTSGYYLSLNL